MLVGIKGTHLEHFLGGEVDLTVFTSGVVRPKNLARAELKLELTFEHSTRQNRRAAKKTWRGGARVTT